MRSLVGLVAFVAVTLGSRGDLLACICFQSGPPCQNAFEADAVFAGTVRRIAAAPEHQPAIGEPLLVEFVVEAAFRGIEGPIATVVAENSNGMNCGFTFLEGERYLVYAHRMEGSGGLYASRCSRTRLFAEADEDLRFLQTLSGSVPSQARISGTVVHREEDMATHEVVDHGPVTGVTVTASGGGARHTARTNVLGEYELSVPPGTYNLSVAPGGALFNDEQTKVELRNARACHVANFNVVLDGRIRGMVWTASGVPAEAEEMELMVVDVDIQRGAPSSRRTKSDADGRFEFSQVPPGRYVVGIDLSRRWNETLVLPSRYFPGTTDRAAALVVELGGGEQRDLGAMTIPPARAPVRLTGSVVGDATVWGARVYVSLRDGQAWWREVGSARTVMDGVFDLQAHEGLTYIVSASYFDTERQRQTEVRTAPFVATADMAPLTLRLGADR